MNRSPIQNILPKTKPIPKKHQIKISSTLLGVIASFVIPISTWTGIELSKQDYFLGFILLAISSAIDFTCVKLGYDYLKRKD